MDAMTERTVVLCPRCHRPLILPTPNGFRIPNGTIEEVTMHTISVRCGHRHPAGSGRCNAILGRIIDDLLPHIVQNARSETMLPPSRASARV